MTIDITLPDFDDPRKFARKQRQKGKSWDEIKNFKTSNCSSTKEWLQNKCEEGWPEELEGELGLWDRLIDGLAEADRNSVAQKEVRRTGEESGTLADSVDPGFTIPSEDDSAWQKYRHHLEGKGFLEDTINSIEAECFKTLKCLKIDNVSSGRDIKGLVIGHVQSGKTANMAGLMAMAADWGFNMFIVLTGTIENLRKQTQDRLFNDLNRPGCAQNWTSLHKLRANMETGQRSVDYNFEVSQSNYLTVSLKNKSRLQSLRSWLVKSPQKLEKMDILLIDDESDQASINTRTDEERTAINSCIIELTKLKAKTMNYVAYTATPYANVLNEAGDGTLYPHSFIRSLPLNHSYFGPELIFGVSTTYQGDVHYPNQLDIVRDVPTNDTDLIRDLHAGEDVECPESLADSLAWFLCAAAARRVYGATTPSSMLIHTSQRIAHHDAVAAEVAKMLDQGAKALKQRCESLWQTETALLSAEVFNDQYPNYAGNPKDYPTWEEVERELVALLNPGLSHIKLDSEGAVEYSRGIHLCIDNGSNNRADEDGNFKRLLYPQTPLDYSPAFIVIGGATLSRGLTIEGLVSTYFLRVSRLGDTLMQMGRWFGYRPGYELLPRIWMTVGSQDQFAYLAAIEAELREQIKIYENSGAKPKAFGPKISHWAPSLLRITAKNKMQSAIVAEMDFSGISNETTIFHEDDTILKKNLNETEKFLRALPPGPETPANQGLLFNDVLFDDISDYLLKMKFHPRSRVFAEIQMFVDWFKDVAESGIDQPYTNWNVIVSSLSGVEEWSEEHENDPTRWQASGKALKKVNRSRLRRTAAQDAFSIGSLQDPIDKFLDVPKELRPRQAPLENEAIKIREQAGLNQTPQLIIYRMNAKTNIRKLSGNRRNLDLDTDVIGLLIRVPGKPHESLVRSITISIPADAYADEAPDVEDAED
jgi:hypothetical protein